MGTLYIVGTPIGNLGDFSPRAIAVPYTHFRAHETVLDLVCRLLLEKKNSEAYLLHRRSYLPRLSERQALSIIHISEPTRLLLNSYAVFCLKTQK